jgi:hypothetical protein
MSTNPTQPVSAPLPTSTAPVSVPLSTSTAPVSASLSASTAPVSASLSASTAPVSAPLPIGAITQSTSTTLDVAVPPIKQMAAAQLTSTMSNMPDVPSKEQYDMNKNSVMLASDMTEVRTTYSTASISNHITHMFLVAIAVYIAVKRNGGINFAGIGPILAAICCPHIFILYVFYTGFCSV